MHLLDRYADEFSPDTLDRLRAWARVGSKATSLKVAESLVEVAPDELKAIQKRYTFISDRKRAAFVWGVPAFAGVARDWLIRKFPERCRQAVLAGRVWRSFPQERPTEGSEHRLVKLHAKEGVVSGVIALAEFGKKWDRPVSRWNSVPFRIRLDAERPTVAFLSQETDAADAGEFLFGLLGYPKAPFSYRKPMVAGEAIERLELPRESLVAQAEAEGWLPHQYLGPHSAHGGVSSKLRGPRDGRVQEPIPDDFEWVEHCGKCGEPVVFRPADAQAEQPNDVIGYLVTVTHDDGYCEIVPVNFWPGEKAHFTLDSVCSDEFFDFVVSIVRG